MKFKPIDNQIGIDQSRSVSTGPSLIMDPRSFPHLSWFNEKPNQNEVNYSFWDGQQWAYYGDASTAYISKEELVSTQQSTVLQGSSPIISFATKQNDGKSDINFIYRDVHSWGKISSNVNYDIKWIGLVEYGKNVFPSFDSSSSSSRDSSSSSSSSSSSLSSSSYDYSSSSMSSESEGNESSSSSSAGTSSSESIGNESSSSSSERTSSSSSSLGSSSSSSEGTSSSSSSSDKSTSSSSHSSWSSPSSSSSRDSTSSESIANFSSSSSSSSSVDDGTLFAVIYDDTNKKFKIYSVSWNYVIRLIGETSESVDNSNSIKISSSGFYIGVTYIHENGIKYAFFDLNDEQWILGGFNDFALSLLGANDTIQDYNIDSYYFEDVCYVGIAWLLDGSKTCVNNGFVSAPHGLEFPFDYVTHELECSSTGIDTSYVVDGYSSITISLNGLLPYILVSGSATKCFVMNSQKVWSGSLIDIEGSATLRPRTITSVLDGSNLNIAFESSGGIYYFENSLEEAFGISNSSLLLLTEAETLHSEYKDRVLDSVIIRDIGNNWFGDIIRERKRPILVTTGELSTSSSSSTSSESTTSLPGPGPDPSSEGFSSEGFSSEGFSSEGFSSEGGSSEGFSSEGFSSEGFSSEGFSSEGFSSEAFSSEGFSSEGFSSEGFSSEGFSSEGFSSEGFSSEGFSSEGFSSEGFSSEGFSSLGYSDGFSESSSSGPHADCPLCNNLVPHYISVTFAETVACVTPCGFCNESFMESSFPSINGTYQLEYVGFSDGNCDWYTEESYGASGKINGTYFPCTDATECNDGYILRIWVSRTSPSVWNVLARTQHVTCYGGYLFDANIDQTYSSCTEFSNLGNQIPEIAVGTSCADCLDGLEGKVSIEFLDL